MILVSPFYFGIFYNSTPICLFPTCPCFDIKLYVVESPQCSGKCIYCYQYQLLYFLWTIHSKHSKRSKFSLPHLKKKKKSCFYLSSCIIISIITLWSENYDMIEKRWEHNTVKVFCLLKCQDFNPICIKRISSLQLGSHSRSMFMLLPHIKWKFVEKILFQVWEKSRDFYIVLKCRNCILDSSAEEGF